jgi:hypothetical protein
MKNLLALLLLCTFAFSSSVNAQITGVQNVPGAYPDLAAAFAALNTQGVGAGGATINVTAPQTCPANGFQLGSLTLNNSLSATNPLIINGNGNTVAGYAGTRAGSLTSGINDAMFVLNGVDYTTIQNFIFNDLATNTTATLGMEHAIGMYNRVATVGSADGCKYINITGCTFNMGNVSNLGAAVAATQYVWDVATAVAWETATQNDIHRSITINNNNFANIFTGIHFRGASGRNGRALVVTNNTFTGIGGGGVATTAYGTFMLNLDSIVYNNNISIGDVTHTNVSYHAFGSTNCGGEQFALNNTLTLQNGTTTSTTHGITFTSIGANRMMNNNTILFGSFPAITSGPINGLVATYTGGNNNIFSEMNNNIINNQTLPPTTGTIILLSNSLSSGTNRVTQTNNNTITNLTRANSGTTTVINLGTANEVNASGNTINNIIITNNSASGTSTFTGINGNGTPPFQNIFNNTVSNVTISGTSTSTTGLLRGIQSTTTTTAGALGEVYGNTIHSLSYGTGVLTGTVAGIVTSSASHNVFKNNIYNLSAAQAGLVRGLEVSSGAVVNIYNNFISNLSTPNANSNIALSGIHMTGGVNANVSYNTIYPSSGASLTSTGALFGATGIYYSSTTTNIATVKNNIVNITGTSNGDAYISAIKRAGLGANGTKPVNFFGSNNIYNAPYVYGEGPTLSTATNVYYITGGTSGTADPTFNTSCGLYKTFMGEEGTFNENNLTSLGNGLFAPSGLSYSESAATTNTVPVITDDYNGVARGTFPDMGALQFSGIGLDATGPSISYALLPNTICTNTVQLSATITDFSGVNSLAGTKPRLYYKRSTNNNVLLTNTNATNGWKFVEATNNSSPYVFDINFSLIFGGTVSPGQTIDYFVVAQDLAGTPNVGTNTASYPTGFCPSSVVLPTGAFPVAGYNTFNILDLPTTISTSSNLTSLCVSGDITLSLTGGVVTGAQYQWQSSPVGANNWTNILGANSITYNAVGVTTSTDFRCVITCGGIPVSVSPSTPVSVTVTNPQVLSTTPAISCTPGPISLSLQAIASAGANINWYENPTGGTAVFTGNNFMTPPITSTTTYYAAASVGGSTIFTGLPAALPPATSGAGTTNFGLVFDVFSPFILESVVVYPIASTAGTTGTVTIDIIDANNNILNTATVNVVGNPVAQATGQTVILNFLVLPGTNLKLRPGARSTGITGLLFEPSASAPSGNYGYPYTIPGVLNILYSTLTAAPTNTQRLDLYYYFYNWKVVTGCESERVPVTASIVTTAPICRPDTSVCLSSAPFILAGATPPGGVYSGTGVSGGQFSPAVAGVGSHIITYTICGLSCTFNITVQNVQPTVTITDTSGGTNNDGIVCPGASATLTSSMGSSYVWSNGATTQSITVGMAGTYTITVTNSIGCIGSTSGSISLTPPPNTSTTLTQPTTCLATNGAIDLTVITTGSFTYVWSTGATTQDISGLGVGSYIVTITSGTTGCTTVLTTTLIGPGGCDACPAIPNINITPSPVCALSTFTMSTNSMTDLGVTYGIKFKSFPTATGTPYSGGTDIAIVSNGMLTASSSAASATASIATAGSYVIYAILDPTPADPNCRPFVSTNLLVNPIPVASIAIIENSGLTPNDGIICQGSTATLTASGGGTYVWSTGASTASISATTAGTYTVTVSSTSGCTAVVNRVIVVNPAPVPVIAITETSGTTSNDGIICQGATATLTCITMGTYLWSNGATTASITSTAAGTFTVTVTNANGCTGTASSNIVVNPLPVPAITVTESSGTPNDGTIFEGTSATLLASGGGTYRWNTNATTPSINVSPLVTNTYTVTVTNTSGCTASRSVIITVIPPPCYIVCAGDQNIILAAGTCEYTLPNFVTFADMCDIYTIVQTQGPVAGSKVGVGTYSLKFELRRKNNGVVMDDCELTLTVQGFTNPVGSLTCNDHVNVSVGPDCRVTLNADMFLEGGNYACYWDYQINIWPNNSQANAINNVPQGVGLNLPFGNHTYEIVGSDGNSCWGTFTVEDKLPPIVNCNCVDNPVITPITNITGKFDFDSPKLEVSTIAAACTKTATANRQMPYAVIIPFTVSAPGSITFAINATLDTNFPFSVNSNFGYQYIYSDEPNLMDLCDNYVIAASFTTNGTFTPTATQLAPIGGQFVPGVTYYYVFASAYIQNIMNYSITFTHNGGGQILSIQNPANAPECQFKCYDIEVVKRETVGMLYNIPGQNQNKSKLTTPPGFTDCGAVGIAFEDRITTSDCGETKLIRDWTATDANGNKATCSQTFTFRQLQFTDLTPPTPTVNLTCGLDASPATISGYTDRDSRTGALSATNIGIYADDWAQTPSVVELHEGFVNAYYTYQQIGFDGNMHAQKVDPSTCNIFTTYHDDMFPACGVGCGGNMKIIRTWKLLDWCTRQTQEYIQVIKAVDEKAPTFEVKDVTISVDPWECVANYAVERPWELQDNCAKPEELKWGVKVDPGFVLTGTQPNYRISGLPKGVHTIIYWAEDCCGNYTEKSAEITVIDASGPVPVAKQNIVLSLTGSGTSADGSGKIYGWQIDNGSYDQCSEVRFEVRRLSGGACGNIGANGTHNNNSTYNDNNGFTSEVPGRVWFHPNDNAQDTDGGEFVKFCCEDIPTGEEFGLHDVELRVWDDGNMNGIVGDNEIIDGMKDNYNTTWVTIRVENKLPPTLVCPPDVTVTCDMELNLSLDSDTPVNSVNLTMTGIAKAFDLCSSLDVTYRDAWIGAHDPICKKGTIRRTFKVTKGSVVVTCPQLITVNTITAPFTVTFPQNNGTTAWDKCTFSLEDARDASNPTIKKPIVNYGQCDIVGEEIKIDTFLFEDGACKKWRVEYTYINWCAPAGQNTLGGFVHYYTYKDEIAPVLTCTNQMFAANPNPANPNGGCEASVILEASATDALVCADESWVKWQGFFDGWADGTVDRLASSFVNKSWNGIWVPQARLIAGQPNPTWIALQNQHPNAPLADLVFVTYVAPSKASGGTVKLPAFILDVENISHKLLWKITDGCGNVDQCESTVMVVDKKAPTPYCLSLSTALMQGTPKMVELWARDFDQGAFDNCTHQSKLYFTFDEIAPIYSRVHEEHFYKEGPNGSVNATLAEYNQGRAYKWLPSSRSAGKVWTTAGDFIIKVSVWDEAWNTDYCSTNLKVISNEDGSRIAGNVATEDNVGVLNTEIIANAALPEYPKSELTDVNGDYDMDIYVNTELSAQKDGDDINGVSTLDLVLIQRHILGLQSLNSPYKLIAADANNDGRVTASDLTEIRKLILGISTGYINNKSWRFPIKNQIMDNGNPFPYIENVVATINNPNPNYDFVAVKIGDVNGSVVTNINNPSVEGRINSNVVMTVADAVVAAGEVVEIPVTAANFSDVAGFQYTMNLEGASFVGINSGAIEMTANNVGVLSNGVVTMSYASNEAVNANEGEVLFTLVVRADKATTVSEVLSMSSDVTKAESYNSDLKVGNVSLSVRTAPVASIELFQNEPNPWKGQTTVSFHMPVAATATLSVYDVTGKVVTVRNIDAAKGLNSEVFTKEQLGVSGVLYYTLVSGEFTATKKMIIVE